MKLRLDLLRQRSFRRAFTSFSLRAAFLAVRRPGDALARVFTERRVVERRHGAERPRSTMRCPERLTSARRRDATRAVSFRRERARVSLRSRRASVRLSRARRCADTHPFVRFFFSRHTRARRPTMLARSLARRGARSRALARVVTARPLDVDGDGTPRAKTTTTTSSMGTSSPIGNRSFSVASRAWTRPRARARRGTRASHE